MRKILQANQKNPARNTTQRDRGGDKILHQIAKEVSVRDIKTAKIRKILQEMSKALKSQDDGVAIAAPQIGYGLRIFIISGKIFNQNFIDDRNKRFSSDAPVDDIKKVKEKSKELVFINPKIIKFSREKEWVPEGCLSVRPFYGKTFRSKKVVLTAWDENGKKITRGAAALLAQIFQHETDHLNGILFIDHAKDIKKEIPK